MKCKSRLANCQNAGQQKDWLPVQLGGELTNKDELKKPLRQYKQLSLWENLEEKAAALGAAAVTELRSLTEFQGGE